MLGAGRPLDVGPRSYTVRTEEGQVLQRNCRNLPKTTETSLELVNEDRTAEASHPPPGDSHISSHSGSHSETPKSPVLRRSTRESRKPERLNLLTIQ